MPRPRCVLGGIVIGVIAFALTTWLNPKELRPGPDDTRLEAAKLCVLNNALRGNSNVLVVLDLVTRAVSSVAITAASQGSLFKELPNCSKDLSESERKELVESEEYQLQLRNAQKMTQVLIGR